MSHVSRFRSRLFLMLRVRIDHLANKRAYLSVPVKPWPVFWLLNILVKCQVTKYHEKSDGDINWWHYVRTVKGETVFQRPFDRILVNSLWLIIYDSFVEKVFGCHTLLFDRALFSLCNISSNIEKLRIIHFSGLNYWFIIELQICMMRTMNRLRWKREFKHDLKKEVK